MSKLNNEELCLSNSYDSAEFQQIIQSNNLVSRTDVNGNIIYVNDEFCDITGFSRDELLGQNHRILKPKERASKDYKPLWATITSGNTYKGIVRNIAKSGEDIYLSSTISPILDKNGDIVEFIAIRFNVTNEIKLQRELEFQHMKLERAYEIAKIGTWEFDTRLKKPLISKEVLNTLGIYEREENMSVNFIENIVHEEDIDLVKQLFENIILDDTKEYKATFRITTQNNSLKWVDCRGKRVPNENKIIGTLQDITEKKIQDDEIKRKERIISQQSKMATMGEMIANIAHQWRQPLSTITTAATGIKLQKELNSLNEETFYTSVDGITESAKYLSKTIDDFRNFFSPHKVKEKFDVKDTFDKTFKLVSSQLYNNEIETIKDISNIEVNGYENELLQVLINILKNAKDEFIKKKDKRLLFIETLKYENNAIIKIKDNAGGIPEKYLANVFDAYFTTKTDDEGGTGIGLYMCKEIIEKSMNGKLQVQNETYSYEGQTYKGANFTITLPCAKD